MATCHAISVITTIARYIMHVVTFQLTHMATNAYNKAWQKLNYYPLQLQAQWSRQSGQNGHHCVMAYARTFITQTHARDVLSWGSRAI